MKTSCVLFNLDNHKQLQVGTDFLLRILFFSCFYHFFFFFFLVTSEFGKQVAISLLPPHPPTPLFFLISFLPLKAFEVYIINLNLKGTALCISEGGCEGAGPDG